MVDFDNPAAGSQPELSDEIIEQLSAMLKLLGEPTRLRIVSLIGRHGQLNVKELYTLVDISQPLVSHHLALLRMAQVVSVRRDGKHNYYTLRRERLAQLMRALAIEHHTHPPCERFLECVLG